MNKKLALILLSALVVQLVGRYYAKFLIVDHFYWIPFLTRFGVPLLIVFLLFRWRLLDLGLGRPQLNRAAKIWMGVGLVLIPLVVSSVRFNEAYLGAYPQYVNDLVPWGDRLERFFFFTLSTFFSWAFLHRGFLLFGIQKVLREEEKLSEPLAHQLAILYVMCFEVLYHILKPDLEAFGLLLASPLFSWLALKTKSLWVPTALHFYIEACFILTLIFLV